MVDFFKTIKVAALINSSFFVRNIVVNISVIQSKVVKQKISNGYVCLCIQTTYIELNIQIQKSIFLKPFDVAS